jgi:hypothetical protein
MALLELKNQKSEELLPLMMNSLNQKKKNKNNYKKKLLMKLFNKKKICLMLLVLIDKILWYLIKKMSLLLYVFNGKNMHKNVKKIMLGSVMLVVVTLLVMITLKKS